MTSWAGHRWWNFITGKIFWSLEPRDLWAKCSLRSFSETVPMWTVSTYSWGWREAVRIDQKKSRFVSKRECVRRQSQKKQKNCCPKMLNIINRWPSLSLSLRVDRIHYRDEEFLHHRLKNIFFSCLFFLLASLLTFILFPFTFVVCRSQWVQFNDIKTMCKML